MGIGRRCQFWQPPRGTPGRARRRQLTPTASTHPALPLPRHHRPHHPADIPGHCRLREELGLRDGSGHGRRGGRRGEGRERSASCPAWAPSPAAWACGHKTPRPPPRLCPPCSLGPLPAWPWGPDCPPHAAGHPPSERAPWGGAGHLHILQASLCISEGHVPGAGQLLVMCVKWAPRCDSVTLCVGVG